MVPQSVHLSLPRASPLVVDAPFQSQLVYLCLQCFVGHDPELLLAVFAAPVDLLGARLAVECSAALGVVWVEGDLAAHIAVTMRLLCAGKSGWI